MGQPPIKTRRHARVEYDLFEYGILKKRLWEGDSEDSQEWTIGHPLIFPGTLLVPYHAAWVQFQFRVPSTTPRPSCIGTTPRSGARTEPPRAGFSLWENPWHGADGKFMPEQINAQDMMVWITQGAITDHTLEHLGESDRGVALYRRTLLEELAKVERGEDPLGVVRDAAENTPYIRLPVEKQVNYSLAGVAASANYAFPERDGTEMPLVSASRAE